MSEEAEGNLNPSSDSTPFQSIDPEAHSNLVAEKIAVASAKLEGNKQGLVGALMARLEFITKFFGGRKKENYILDTKADDGGQAMASSPDVDRALNDSLAKKLGQTGSAQ